jgi:hypothetical protein
VQDKNFAVLSVPRGGTGLNAAGTVGNVAVSDGTRLKSVTPASFQGSSASPAGTTSLTGVMMGLAGTITPSFSGRIIMSVSGNVKNNTIGDGAFMQLRYGAATKPSNGDATAGTAIGGIPQLINTASGTFVTPISSTAIATGLTVGTVYWLDVELRALTGGTAQLQSTAISAHEF